MKEVFVDAKCYLMEAISMEHASIWSSIKLMQGGIKWKGRLIILLKWQCCQRWINITSDSLMCCKLLRHHLCAHG